MIIKKITTGFVVQTYDTKLKRFINQEFVAGDPVEHEDEKGNPVSNKAIMAMPYLPFDMKQPRAPKKARKTPEGKCSGCGFATCICQRIDD